MTEEEKQREEERKTKFESLMESIDALIPPPMPIPEMAYEPAPYRTLEDRKKEQEARNRIKQQMEERGRDGENRERQTAGQSQRDRDAETQRGRQHEEKISE